MESVTKLVGAQVNYLCKPHGVWATRWLHFDMVASGGGTLQIRFPICDDEACPVAYAADIKRNRMEIERSHFGKEIRPIELRRSTPRLG